MASTALPHRVRIAFTLEVDLLRWADDYGMTVAEAREALNETAREAMLQYLGDNGHAAAIGARR